MPELPVAPELPIPSATGLVAAQSTFGLSKRTEGTISLLRTVVQESSATFWYEKGKAHSEQQEWQEAVHAFRQCTDRDARHWRGAIQLALALAQQQWAGAEIALRQAYEMPHTCWQDFVMQLTMKQWYVLQYALEARKETVLDGFDLFFALALVYRAINDKKRARQTLEVMEFLYGLRVEKSALWFRLSGALWSDQIEPQKALAHYNRAIEQDPRQAAIYFDRGYTKYNLQDYNGAQVDYILCLEIDPIQDQTYLYRNRIQGQLAYFQQDLILCDQAILCDSTDLESVNRRSIIRKDLKDIMGELTDLMRCVELDPKDNVSYYHLGVIKLCLRDYVGGMADIDKSCTLDKIGLAYLPYLFSIEKNTCLSHELPTEMDRHLALNPIDQRMYRYRGLVRYAFKDFTGAIADLQQYIEFNPTDTTTHHYCGWIKHEMGDYTGAIASFDQFVELAPTDPIAYLKRGYNKHYAKDYEGALVDLNYCLKLDSTIGLGYATRARVKEQLDDFIGQESDRKMAMQLGQRL
ncbi:tetratricopeptide repeat protein [Hymenobacter aerophilus]|uniref:tetratricopeptide repeat protein n=1 Tax=Hymenobacter aerophilus TaxID=119644 RepID=UPI0003754EC3|nr:tetratricopeptide repeat protein [Hymenobacter aerophilus]